ncbi:MAG: T9SS type A sorting domain-containing protein, partial [Chitinophagales bacterium]|nr:T9SS type A sorting domain-containing protein [Chitinophagales bacterium]
MKFLCIGLFFSISTSTFAQDINWTGAGDGTSWEDPDNWDTGAVPTDQDFARIGGTALVTITSNAEARRVRVRDDASLTITTIGQLSCPTNTGGAILRVRDNATFVNSGVLSITGLAGGNAIRASHMTSLTNGGMITISDSEEEAIFLQGNASFHNGVNATISILSSGSDAVDMEDDAVFTNYGSMSSVDLDEEGIDMDDDAVFYNYGSMYFELIDDNDAVDMDDDDTLFENYGTMTIVDIIDAGEAIEVDDGLFINKPNGQITMMNVTGDAIKVQTDGTLRNYGYISVDHNPETESDEAVEIECGALFSNNGVLDITNNGNTSAIEVECSGTFINEDCGEVNILTNNVIDIEDPAGTFTNYGILNTASTTASINFGTFTNNGVINSMVDFTTAPNPVVEGPAVPAPWSTFSVGNSGMLGNDFAFLNCEQEFVVTGGGNNATSFTTDNVAFVSQYLCGNDVSITAKIESVDPNGYGGLMIRDPEAAGARQVSIFSNLTNVLRHESRSMTNAPKQVQAFYKPSPFWLRLQRQGDWVFAYYSTTGANFQYVHAVFVPMQNCVEVGLASFTYAPAQQTTAVFSNVSVSGGIIPSVEVPSTPEVETAVSVKTTTNLYPNPATDVVNLEFSEALNQDATVRLLSTMGQLIEQRELRAGDITSVWNVSTLVDGMYLFEIRKEGEPIQVVRLV